MSMTLPKSLTYASRKSYRCVVEARNALSYGIRFTSPSPCSINSFAWASIQLVTRVFAGPPFGGLYLIPPSSGGLCDGVMTIASAIPELRSRL